MNEAASIDRARAVQLPDDRPDVIQKVARRVMWWLVALYFFAILDRSNVAYAAVPMARDIGLTAAMFGVGVGIMYFTYSLFEVPSNLLLARFGARLTLTRIAMLWGMCTMATAWVWSPGSFYVLRALLGVAEAGLFPGVMLYLTFWFPARYRARYNAFFNYAIPAASIFGSLISGAILSLDGFLGVAGWKWLYILEGIPAVLLGVACHFFLSDTPAQARWLSPEEKAWLQSSIVADRVGRKEGETHAKGTFLSLILNPKVILLGLCNSGLFCGLVTGSAWLPQIVHGFGLDFVTVGILVACPSVAGVFGMIWFSRRSDRINERFGHAGCAFLLTGAGFLLAAAGMASLPLVLIGFAIVNAGVFAAQAVFWTIPQSFLSERAAPGAIGVIAMMGSIGGALSPVFVGWIKDHTGGFVAGFLAVASILLAAAGALLLLGLHFRRT